MSLKSYPKYKIVMGSIEKMQPIYDWVFENLKDADEDTIKDIVDELIQIGFHQGISEAEFERDENESLEEAVEIHDKLNPKIWTEEKELIPEVRAKILQIVDAFKNLLALDGVDLKVDDIYILGSNANFNYNEDSDLDIHIMADETFDCSKEHLKLIYDAYKSLFNSKFDITIKGINAELFVENKDKMTNVSAGVYSLKDGWLRDPAQYTVPEIDEIALDKAVQKWEDKYYHIIENPSIKQITEYIDEIYSARKQSVESEGEFGLDNLAFKEIRRLGYLKDLKDLKNELTSKELSLESLDEDLKENKNAEDLIDKIKDNFSKFKNQKLFLNDEEIVIKDVIVNIDTESSLESDACVGDVLLKLDSSKVNDITIPFFEFETAWGKSLSDMAKGSNNLTLKDLQNYAEDNVTVKDTTDRFSVEDEPGHSLMRGWFNSQEAAEKAIKKYDLKWWRINKYDNNLKKWVVVAKSDDVNESLKEKSEEPEDYWEDELDKKYFDDKILENKVFDWFTSENQHESQDYLDKNYTWKDMIENYEEEHMMGGGYDNLDTAVRDVVYEKLCQLYQSAFGKALSPMYTVYIPGEEERSYSTYSQVINFLKNLHASEHGREIDKDSITIACSRTNHTVEEITKWIKDLAFNN